VSAPFQILRPSSPLGYRRVIADLVDLLPWKQEPDSETPESIPHVLARKVGGAEMQRRAQRFLVAWNAYAETDLFFFGRYCTRTGDRVHPRYGVQMDRPRLDDPGRYYLFEMYRELERLLHERGKDGRPLLHKLWIYHTRRGFKSTAMKDLILQAYHRIPGYSVVVYSKRKKPQATDRVASIRLECETNRLLHRMRPDLYWGAAFEGPEEQLSEVVRGEASSAGVEWSSFQFGLKRHGADLTRADPSCRAAGILAGLYTGASTSMRCFDDCVDDENAKDGTGSELATQTLQAFRQAQKITDPALDPLDVYVGTDYEGKTPYQMAIQQGIIRRVWRLGALNMDMPDRQYEDIGGGTPIFLDADELREQRGKDEEAWLDFVRQYLCDPSRAGHKPLDADGIAFYSESPERFCAGCPLVATMDPGGSGYHLSKKGMISDSSWGIWALLPGGHFALLDAQVDIMTPTQRAEALVAAVASWTNRGFSFLHAIVEQPAQNSDGEHIAAEQDRTKVYFPVYSIPRGGRKESSKKERLYRCLEPMLSGARLHFPEGLTRSRRHRTVNLGTYIRDKVGEFPAGKWLDALDMVALLAEPEGRRCFLYQGGVKPREPKHGLPRLSHPARRRNRVFGPSKPKKTRASKHSFLLIGVPGHRRAVA